MGIYDWMFDQTPELLESAKVLPDGIHKKSVEARQYFSGKKQEKLQEVIEGYPPTGQSWHILSSGRFDFFSFVPTLIERLGGYVEVMHGSTWTMNRNNVVELVELFDAGKIGKLYMYTGTYFKRRESSVYATLVQAIMERKQKFVAFENHAKILLLSSGMDFLCVEGSANFTSNPRLEQYCISNDKGLFDFYSQRLMEQFA